MAAVIEALDLRDAVLVGDSTGGGEAVRYVDRHGSGRTKKPVLIGAVPPLMLQMAANPKGTPTTVFDTCGLVFVRIALKQSSIRACHSAGSIALG